MSVEDMFSHFFDLFQADLNARRDMIPELRSVLEEYDVVLQFTTAAKKVDVLPEDDIQAIMANIPGSNEAVAEYL